MEYYCTGGVTMHYVAHLWHDVSDNSSADSDCIHAHIRAIYPSSQASSDCIHQLVLQVTDSLILGLRV